MSSKRVRDGVGIDPNRIVSAAVEAALGQSEPSKKKRHPGRMLAAGAAVAAAATVGQRRMPALAKAPLRMAAHKLGDVMHVDDLVDAVQDRVAGRDRQPDDYDDEDLDRVDPGSDEFDDEDLDDEPADDLDGDEDSEEPLDEAEDLDDEAEDEDEGFDDEDDEGFDDEPEDSGGPEGEGDADEPDEEPEDDPDAESEDATAEEEPLEDEEPEDEEPFEDEEQLEDDEEDEEGEEQDDEQVAARGLELGVVAEPRRAGPRDQAPDLFTALRTPRRRRPVMRRDALRVDPATRPPEPERSRGKQSGDRRTHNSNSMAARR